MNKLLLSSICAAALTTGASAFTLDLSSLNGRTLGYGEITNSFGTFKFQGSGTETVQGGVINLNNGRALTIVYPASVTYNGAFTSSGITTNNTPNAQTVQYLANQNGSTVGQITFNAVPEPSSTALIGLGGLALILRRRK